MSQAPSPGDAKANRIGPVRAAAARSTAKGDLPEGLLERYLVERDGQGRPERFFRDHRSAEPHFRDRGRSLSASGAYPDAVQDMLKIARHRGWSQLKVSGEPAFRREVWIRAQPLGLEVSGYRPRQRDRQAAGIKDDPSNANLSKRIQAAAVIVRGLVSDPQVQARLIAGAWARANERPAPERKQSRERTPLR